MRLAFKKLFESGPDSAKTSQHAATIQEVESKAASAAGGDAVWQGRHEDSTLKYEKVSCNFDSIGQRNETLRARLESIEFSFRDIEAIRTQFHDALTSIDQTLVEIERTKVANLEAERRLENLTAANDRLHRDRAALTVEREALAVARDELLARISDLEQMVAAGEAASSVALEMLAERSAKLEQTERDLDDNRRALHALGEQLPAIRTEFVSKETRLRDVEQQRTALNDHCGLLTQENDALRTRTEELVVDASKLSRQLSELRDERDELKGLLRERETSFDHETAAHANLKAAYFEAIEVQRLNEASLQEKLSATTTRLEAAEQLLVEARTGMHEQEATIRESEQRVLEKSLEVKSLEAQVTDLEKDLASARAGHVEAEVARTLGAEQTTTLAKSLQDKEVALQRAEQKVARVEAKFDEHKRATLGDRALFEEKIAKLTEQLDAESAARLFAEGALRSARQERSARRQEGHDVAAESLPAETESADSKVTWLSR
jgi:predicted  nucleic acid-binding Zn-ribbon protein